MQASVTIDGIKFVIDSGFVKVLSVKPSPSILLMSYIVDSSL